MGSETGSKESSLNSFFYFGGIRTNNAKIRKTRFILKLLTKEYFIEQEKMAPRGSKMFEICFIPA